MSYEALIYTVEAGVCTITLNRPDKMNSFNAVLLREFIEALRKAERDEAVRCVVITGSGRAFCAGADLSELGQVPVGELLRKYYNVWCQKIRSMEKPVLAAVNGVAAGAGLSLALACDLIILSEKASYIQAFIKVGLVPDSGASYLLPRLVGYHKAMELALFGDRITPQQILELGLCNRVVAEEAFPQIVSEWAAKLARGPRSMGWHKRLITRGLEAAFEESLELEAHLQTAAFASVDAQEAVRAFAEKREPKFTGK